MTGQPVPVPDAAALAALPLPLTACAACGFLGIRAATQQEGFVAGTGETMGLVVCPRCGHQGFPARFERRGDYADYVRKLRAAGP